MPGGGEHQAYGLGASLAQAEHVRAEVDRQVRRHVVTWDQTRWTCTCGDTRDTRPT